MGISYRLHPIVFKAFTFIELPPKHYSPGTTPMALSTARLPQFPEIAKSAIEFTKRAAISSIAIAILLLI